MEIYHQALNLNHHKKYFCHLGLVVADLDHLKQQATTFLHEEEYRQFKTLHHDKRQHSFLLSRYCAKQVVADNQKLTDLTSFQILNGIFQQPILSGFGLENIHVSMSHSHQLAATLTFPSTLIMGIDIEKIDVKFLQTLKSQTKNVELELIKQFFSYEDSLLPLTLFWTIKEALSKALKTGLTISLDLLAIKSIQPINNYWQSEYHYFPQYQALSFQLQDYACSLVLPKQLSISFCVEPIREWLEASLKRMSNVSLVID